MSNNDIDDFLSTNTTDDNKMSNIINGLQYRDPSSAIDISKLNNSKDISVGDEPTLKSDLKSDLKTDLKIDLIKDKSTNAFRSILKPVESALGVNNDMLTVMGYNIPITTIYFLFVIIIIACILYFVTDKKNKDEVE